MKGDRDQFWGSLSKWYVEPLLLVYEHITETRPDRFRILTEAEADSYCESLMAPTVEDSDSLALA